MGRGVHLGWHAPRHTGAVGRRALPQVRGRDGGGDGGAVDSRLRRELALPREQRADQWRQLADVERLAEQYAVLDAALVEIERGAGAQEEDACALRALGGAQAAIDFGAVKIRQAHV